MHADVRGQQNPTFMPEQGKPAQMQAVVCCDRFQSMAVNYLDAQSPVFTFYT